jgi:IclR family acetate operon transcriptional repressor
VDAALTSAEGRPAAVQSVDRALRLLELLGSAPGGAGVAELSRAAGLPPGSVHRLLQTLSRRGWVRQDGNRRYLLGTRLMPLGAAAGALLAAGARPYLAELVRLSGESANLAVLEGDRVAYIAQVPSPHRLRMFAEVGNRVPAHSTGVGKVLLAYLPPAEVDAIVGQAGLASRTPSTITDVATLRAELDRTRAAAYAVDAGEEEVGVRCVAVPVLRSDGSAAAAMSVSGPTERFGSVDEAALADRMHEVAARFATRVLGGGAIVGSHHGRL